MTVRADRHSCSLRRGVLTAALVASLSCLGPDPARSESGLPFTPAFAGQVEVTFFEAGRVSPDRVEAYRALLRQRRDEVVSLFESSDRASGRSKKSARKRAARKKQVRVYELLTGDGEQPGWLDRLLAESDPRAARVLAGRILEVDRALLVSGARPSSQVIPENLASISVLEWSTPSSTRARRADREATNLVDPETGLFFQADDLRAYIEAGGDVSALDPPADSTFWRDPGPVAERKVSEVFYRGGHPVHQGLEIPFPESRGELDGVKKSQTKPKFELEVTRGDEEFDYKLKVGGEIHSEPVTGALLATLGFNADVTKHVKNFRIDIGDRSVAEIRDEWRSYFEFKRIHLSYRFDDYFEVGEDEDGRFLIAREASLTAKPRQVTRVGPWPWGANGNEGIREARALGLLSIWLGNTDMKEAENNKLLLRERADGEMEMFHLHHDLGHAFGRVISEQVDAFPWDLARRTWTGEVEFNYHSTWNPSLRERITYADARWMTRLIAQLTREQIEEAVSLGVWPEPVARLLVEKLIHRRNQLVEAYELVGTQTASGPVAILEVDRELTTADGSVVDGELVNGVFEGSTQDFDNYWSEFVGPVWEATKLFGVGLFQQTIGLVPALIFDKDSVGLPKVVVLNLLITLRRDVEENPRPTGENDYYLVRDQLLLGIEVGGGLIATGTTAYYRSYTLVQPAGTKREAHFAGDTILNVRLPYHVWKERLPSDFTLVRESYVDVRANLTTETLGGSVPVVGATGSAGLVRLSRDVLARKGGTLRAYEDRSVYTDQFAEAFVNAIFVRIPFLHQDARQGGLDGRYFELPAEADRNDDKTWSDALSKLIRDGDFSGVEGRVPSRAVESSFNQQLGWARVPLLIQRYRTSRFDRVTLGAPTAPGAEPVGDAESFVQYTSAGGGFWRFLDWGEDHLKSVSTLARATSTEDEDHWELETPRIVSTFFQRDRNTFDDELGGTYIGFINGVWPGKPLVDFTPALHSQNHRWGDLEVAVRVGYSRKGVERLRRLDPAALWRRLGDRLGVGDADLHRYRRHIAVQGKWAQARRARIPNSHRGAIFAAHRALQALDRASEAEEVEDWMTEVVDGLSRAAYRRGGWFAPPVLGALHDVIGKKHITVEAVVRPPPWVENRLVGSTPIAAETDDEPNALSRTPIDLAPGCTAAIYSMLDTFSGDDITGGHYGNVCDGARASFVR